jgi:hypothetical protein
MTYRSPTWALIRLILWRAPTQWLCRVWRRVLHIADVGPGACPHGIPMVDACPECGR